MTPCWGTTPHMLNTLCSSPVMYRSIFVFWKTSQKILINDNFDSGAVRRFQVHQSIHRVNARFYATFHVFFDNDGLFKLKFLNRKELVSHVQRALNITNRNKQNLGITVSNRLRNSEETFFSPSMPKLVTTRNWWAVCMQFWGKSFLLLFCQFRGIYWRVVRGKAVWGQKCWVVGWHGSDRAVLLWWLSLRGRGYRVVWWVIHNTSVVVATKPVKQTQRTQYFQGADPFVCMGWELHLCVSEVLFRVSQ
jgi:hypothetical protein